MVICIETIKSNMKVMMIEIKPCQSKKVLSKSNNTWDKEYDKLKIQLIMAIKFNVSQRWWQRVTKDSKKDKKNHDYW